MRSEAEIRRKLKEVEKRRDRKPTLWSVLVWDIYRECFAWVLADRPSDFWKEHDSTVKSRRRR